MEPRDKFLLHICCAPCAPHPVRVLKETFALTLYFYNPNIHPASEYRARLEEARRFALAEGVPLVEGEYRPREWLKMAAPHRHEPERGKRCALCIGARLGSTARMAATLGAGTFGTVLTISRLKNALMINSLGRAAADALRGAGVRFHEADWKKREGEKISLRLSAGMGLRRQDYCGCVFSRMGDKRPLHPARAAEA